MQWDKAYGTLAPGLELHAKFVDDCTDGVADRDSLCVEHTVKWCCRHEWNDALESINPLPPKLLLELNELIILNI